MAVDKGLRTGAWYGDHPLGLEFPPDWNVTILWPRTTPPLTDEQIAGALERPVGQLPIRQLCKGKSRPLVIVDDLTRPTPADRVMPFLFRHFQDAGIVPEQVRVLIATGTHGSPRQDGLSKKVGLGIAKRCRLIVHDHGRDLVELGSTSFGTPVSVNREVAKSDFVVGIGGIFPSGNLGFSGGSKLALGVLGIRSITHLHAHHHDVRHGLVERSSSFRRDLDEIARMIGLHAMVTIHVNSDRSPVRLVCGDHFAYFEAEMAFAREVSRTVTPEDADVVICNTYPSDISLTIACNKGMVPFSYCSPTASRIAIASCSEGVGFHGLFPLLNAPTSTSQWDLARRILKMSPAEFASKVAERLFRKKKVEKWPRNPLWLYRPGEHTDNLPSRIAGISITSSWPQIVEAVSAEQNKRSPLKVLIYPCAPLQCFE